MKLEFAQIQAITLGAVRVDADEHGISFHRFTEAQKELYKNRWLPFYMRTLSPSGVRIRFRTDSETLQLIVGVSEATDRSYFAFDIFVNGEKCGALDNFSNVELPLDYTKVPFQSGDFSKKFYLGSGEKEVCIYFPWSVKVSLKALEIDEGAYVEPVKPGKKLLCFGDSITQGYDALYPSNKYISKLADALDAEEFNKAVGGDFFFPELVSEKEHIAPDYITVAYGTNDWSSCRKEASESSCKAFFRNLNKHYPKARIFVITPIWRKDHTEPKDFGKFEEVEQMILRIAGGYNNVTVISGYHFVDHDERLFADLRLHPNDEGFKQYFQNLLAQIHVSYPETSSSFRLKTKIRDAKTVLNKT